MFVCISSLSVSLLCVCLHCTVSSAYTSAHNLATHMCHLPYNCHLHSQWARLRHTKVACHIHVSFVPALTETRRSGILSYFILQFPNPPFSGRFFFFSWSGEDSDYTCPSQVSTFMSSSIWPSWQQSNCERCHKNDHSRGLMDPTASVRCQPWPDAAALRISLHRGSRIGALFSRFVLLDVYWRIAVRQQSIERS